MIKKVFPGISQSLLTSRSGGFRFLTLLSYFPGKLFKKADLFRFRLIHTTYDQQPQVTEIKCLSLFF